MLVRRWIDVRENLYVRRSPVLAHVDAHDGEVERRNMWLVLPKLRWVLAMLEAGQAFG
jgi:hypothetical protein